MAKGIYASAAADSESKCVIPAKAGIHTPGFPPSRE